MKRENEVKWYPIEIEKDNFNIKDGHPTFDRTYSDPIDANEYAAKLIKPDYRDGWKLPDMPIL